MSSLCPLKAFRSVSTIVLAVFVGAIATSTPGARAEESAIRPYQPRAVEIPKDASYVRPDGSIYIVGDDAMEEALAQLNELFVKTHPGFKFSMLMKGSSTGIGGLTSGVSALAPMGRPAWAEDLGGFKESYGYYPADIHIGYDAFTHTAHKSPPAIYVNAKNPLAGLTIAQLTRVFTSGAKDGDITQWRQLGLKGEWEKRAIHLYGTRDDGALATTIRLNLLGKLPFSPRYEPMDHIAETIKAVSQDPYGIALAGFFDANDNKDVKILPLATKEGEPFVTPTYDDVHAGRYPLASDLRLYVNRAPGKPLDPFVKEYLRLALSKEGQAIIAAGKDNEQGFVPLDEAAIRTELAKLE